MEFTLKIHWYKNFSVNLKVFCFSLIFKLNIVLIECKEFYHTRTVKYQKKMFCSLYFKKFI